MINASITFHMLNKELINLAYIFNIYFSFENKYKS